MEEGETVNINCEAVYGGPRFEHLAESHVPKLVSYMEGYIMSDVSTTIIGEPGKTYFIVKQVCSFLGLRVL